MVRYYFGKSHKFGSTSCIDLLFKKKNVKLKPNKKKK